MQNVVKGMDHSFFSGQAPTISRKQRNVWHKLDMGGLQGLWTVYATDFIARSAKNYIAASLLTGGLVLSDTHLSTTPGPDFNAFISDNFIPFFADLIDWIYVLGFAPYTVSEEGIPRVVPFGLLQFKYLIDDDFQIQLGAFDSTNTDDDPLKDIYFVFDNRPNADGSVVSATAIYYTHRLFRDTLLRNTAIANYLMARPPIYLTSQTNKSQFQNTDITNIGEIDGLRASIANDSMLTHNKIQMNVHNAQESLVGQLNAKRSALLGDTALKTRMDPFTGLQSYDKDLTNEMDLQPTIPLPMDTAPAHVDGPRAPDNLVATLNQQLVIAAGCFGMSLEAIGLERGGGARSAETINLENRVANNTVRKFRNIFVQTTKNIYDLIWATKKQTSAGLNILFPATLDRPTMLDLFQKGIVSFEGLTNYLGANMDIPATSFNKTFNPPLDVFKQDQQEATLKMQAANAAQQLQLQGAQAQDLARLQAKLAPKPTV